MGQKRIPDNTFDLYFDGGVLSAADLNKLILVLKGGINTNKLYLDTLIGGDSDVPIVESYQSLPTVAEDGDYGFVFQSEDLDEDGYEKKYNGLLWYIYDGTSSSWVNPTNIEEQSGAELNMVTLVDWAKQKLDQIMSAYEVNTIATISSGSTILFSTLYEASLEYDIIILEFDFLQTGSVGRGTDYLIYMSNPTHVIRNVSKELGYHAGVSDSPRYGSSPTMTMNMYTTFDFTTFIGSIIGRLVRTSETHCTAYFGNWNIELANWNASMFSLFIPRMRIYGMKNNISQE